MRITENIPDLHTTEIQIGKKGKPFYNIGVEEIPGTRKWIGRKENFCTKHTFKYVDGSGYFDIYIDYYGKRITI